MENRIFFLILTILLICASIILYYYVKKKFYKKSFAFTRALFLLNNRENSWDILNDWMEEKFQLALFFPKLYFRKDTFWKGYLLYLLSIFFLILGFVAFYFWLTLKGV